MSKTLYIHGFASTGASSKVDQLREITGGDVVAPDLSHRPYQDIALLETLVTSEGITTVVGSSLGGFYALYLAQRFDLGAVLINPSLTPYNTLRDQIGTVSIYGTDRTFVWSERELAELLDLSKVITRALGRTSGVFWKNVIALYAVHDERLDAKATAAMMPYATAYRDEKQDHRFANLMPYADAIRSIVNTPPYTEDPTPF